MCARILAENFENDLIKKVFSGQKLYERKCNHKKILVFTLSLVMMVSMTAFGPASKEVQSIAGQTYYLAIRNYDDIEENTVIHIEKDF